MTAATFVMVRVGDGAALMELRKDGHWCYPGGKVEDGEDVGSALVREMREEVGCRPTSVTPLQLVAYGRTDQIGNADYRMHAYAVWAWDGDVTGSDGSQDDAGLSLEGTPLRWVALEDALETGRGSCVTPIASAVLWHLEAARRMAEEPTWR